MNELVRAHARIRNNNGVNCSIEPLWRSRTACWLREQSTLKRTLQLLGKSTLHKQIWTEQTTHYRCTGKTRTFNSTQRTSNSDAKRCSSVALLDLAASLESWNAPIIDWNFDWQACTMSDFKILAEPSNSGSQTTEQKALAEDTRENRIAVGMNSCWNAVWTESLGTAWPWR